ncbi:phage head closure protein [Citrobacter freundii]|uniref:phage head closure protein n=1 Tax=Enterobacteriaceae TaxID=543 RepID=UPI000BE6B713|nr:MULTISPECIES: phage head closure protein [Enterobacteriaceae]DAL04774.1 MAG TPA: Putative head tail adaptor [Caudoviricetes sp.]EJD6418617.1 phage head closure protein [Citrobacter freundii]EJD6622184.1 phage head closure protein [Citrobacter freundii]ELV1432350.1 phage head closure protein [Escherichia coli]MCW3394176.1 phage head closure protein [Escherichia coli]
MRAGGLKHRITLQRYEQSQGPLGEPIKRWVDYATIWAEVKGISGRELLATGSLSSEATVRIWIRYRSDVKQGHRVKYLSPAVSGDIYGIEAALPDNNRTSLELLCKGGVANG